MHITLYMYINIGVLLFISYFADTYRCILKANFQYRMGRSSLASDINFQVGSASRVCNNNLRTRDALHASIFKF